MNTSKSSQSSHNDNTPAIPNVFRGPGWGVFEASPIRSVSGRLLIHCTPTNGQRSYCITVSRWISERRAGGIIPA